MSAADPTTVGPVRVGWLEDGHVLDLQIDAGKGNVLTGDVMNALREALDIHGTLPGLRLVILRAAGRHFSFGASVAEHQALQVRDMLTTFHRLIRTVGRHEVPVAALVDGQCLGGAFELVLACHFVFATDRAVMACPEIKLGVFPPVLAAIGAQRLGGALAEQLLLTGAPLDLDVAKHSGFLTHRIKDDADPLEAVLGWYREHLAPLSAWTVRTATRVTRTASGLHAAFGASLDRVERHYLEQVVPSHDGNEGLAAFLEGRKPSWEDR